MLIPNTFTVPEHTAIANVPFYSQFNDIHLLSWKKVGCGITSLAMIIDYHSTQTISVDSLLKAGIASNAYDKNYGWIHQGLINLSKKYGLNGASHDVSSLGKDAAFAELLTFLDDGPVIVSIHYKFDPRSSIPHLVVLDGIENGTLTYNDSAAKTGQKQISSVDFQRAWKKKFIVIRPVQKDTNSALM